MLNTLHKDVLPSRRSFHEIQGACGLSSLKHLVILPDGNRRWGREHGITPDEAHKIGFEKVLTIGVNLCLMYNIPYFTIPWVSFPNFIKRAPELDALFSGTQESCERHLNDFIKQGVRLSVVGERQCIPQKFLEGSIALEEATKGGTKLHVAILNCYDGQREVVHAVKVLAQKVKNNEITLDDINQNLVAKNMFEGSFPAPDLIIRAGGRHRLTGLYSYQSGYSELLFIDTLWPDVTWEQLELCLQQYAQRIRSFGV